MPTREMKHPDFEIEDADEGLRVTFRIPYSKFDSVEVVLSLEEVGQLVDSLEQAVAFADDAGPRVGDNTVLGS